MTRVARLPGLVAIAPEIAEVLAAHGYTPSGLSGDRTAPDHVEATVLAHRLADTALATMVALFLAGTAIPRQEVADALQPLTIDVLVGAGLLTIDGDRVRSAVRIGWCDGLLVCHDWHDGRATHREDVVGVGQASLTLSDLTVRLPDVDALDVGTGGGVQAFLATRHARTVTGTDINSRALDLAAFGAGLNGLRSPAWREGSLFEPVADDTFDLITVNPPFIISPDNTFMWRDATTSAAPGGLCGLLLGEVARHLRPDGWGSMLASWLHDADCDWSTPVRSWLTGLGCDAWILRFSSETPLGYAHTWLGQTEHTATGFASALDRWLDFYRDQHVDAIATGAIILHRRTDLHCHTWTDEMPASPTGPAGAQIRRAFAQRRRLSGLGDRSGLLDEVLAPLAGTSLDQTLHWRDGAYHPAPTHLWVQPGLTISAAVPPTALPVLLELDGQRPLRDVIGAAVQNTGFDLDEVRDETLTTAVRLIELGLIEWR